MYLLYGYGLLFLRLANRSGGIFDLRGSECGLLSGCLTRDDQRQRLSLLSDQGDDDRIYRANVGVKCDILQREDVVCRKKILKQRRVMALRMTIKNRRTDIHTHSSTGQ